ncbi:MAG: formate--phosphoribosylaminoimidazolecarboxamide ligase [Candidatus Methanospirareceae archaeon]
MRGDIKRILQEYDTNNLVLATICSHSALQIFQGAKKEGFKTLGICTEGRKKFYESFPLAKPDEFIIVDSYRDIASSEVEGELLEKNAILIPHGSFVEYVGAENIFSLKVPFFGNREALEWEADREKERKWLEKAGIRMPKEMREEEIEGICIVKFYGAKGGKGSFIVKSKEEFNAKITKIGTEEKGRYTIQEYIIGLRYYPHFFYSPILDRLELLGIDRRDENNIDALPRLGLSYDELSEIATYVVTGNIPLILRESLLTKVMEMGEGVVKSSQTLFPPGIIGPFCLEAICTDDLEFIVFEISARIVAGTNLYPRGSPYSCYYFEEEMSMGRRIAREIRLAKEREELEKIIS